MSDLLVEGTDAGYAFLGPAVLQRTKTFKNGVALGAYHQTGVIVSETPESPWHHATFFVQGTRVTDAKGEVVPRRGPVREHGRGWRPDLEHPVARG